MSEGNTISKPHLLKVKIKQYIRRKFKWLKRNFRFERVLFCDLDGTLIETISGKVFPENKDDWRWKSHILEAIKMYNPTHLHIISNQGGIEKGYIDHMDFHCKMETIKSILCQHFPHTRITDCYCISNDPEHPMRKPNSGMIDLYVTDFYNGTDCDRKNCLMIGDASGREGQFSDSDKKCAENANVKYMDVDDFIKKYNPHLLTYKNKIRHETI